MTAMTHAPLHAGDPAHPHHGEFIAALGRASWEAAYLAGGMLDVLRIHLGLDYWDLTQDTHGRLRARLEQRANDLPGLADAIPELVEAVTLRNALAHATPVLHGLQYRTKDREVVNFFDVDDLERAVTQFQAAARTVNRLLYHDGGKAVRQYAEGR